MSPYSTYNTTGSYTYGSPTAAWSAVSSWLDEITIVSNIRQDKTEPKEKEWDE